MKEREWLRSIRNYKFLTQEDVATKANISRSYYTRIESGTQTPSIDVAKRVASVLIFDWAIFFEDECSLKEQKRLA
ncbi:helix-turn-helix transcriptional regulator [Viridibacillus arvi]|uniref:helix-turn-helix transcriptional regulator n=1 Tax=Viridibacillus arvi TaxID=263475 RepID=UPI00380D8B2C